jgi:hypothetical protein
MLLAFIAYIILILCQQETNAVYKSVKIMMSSTQNKNVQSRYYIIISLSKYQYISCRHHHRRRHHHRCRHHHRRRRMLLLAKMLMTLMLMFMMVIKLHMSLLLLMMLMVIIAGKECVQAVFIT